MACFSVSVIYGVGMSQLLNRREMLKGGVAAAALFCARTPVSALALGGDDAAGELLPFYEQVRDPKRQMVQWAQLKDWMTPLEDFFAVSHYGKANLDAAKWHLK